MNGASGFQEVRSSTVRSPGISSSRNNRIIQNWFLAPFSWPTPLHHRRVSCKNLAPLILFVMPLLFTGCDHIAFINDGTSSTGVLVDGIQDGVDKNDHTLRSSGTDHSIWIGNFSGGPGEVIAFTKERPPTIKNVTWSSFSDSVVVTFQAPYPIPVYVWIVAGNKIAQRQKALLASVETERIWMEERQGIRFSSFNINDQFMDPELSRFSCTANNVEAIKRNTRYQEGAINVYYVEQVLGSDGLYSAGNGIHCGAALNHTYDDVIVIGQNTQPALLAHEFGHAFALIHVGHLSEFSETNVMHESSNIRQYLTEGQTFRQATHTESSINTIYKRVLGLAGISLPQPRNCYPVLGHNNEIGWFDDSGGQTAEEKYNEHLRECPLLQKRIWWDGKKLPEFTPGMELILVQ